MPDLIPFTSNITDCSTTDGYQFEFHCQRCGNGFRSRFRHSVTGFGGRLAALGGSILGGEIGSRVEHVGLMAQWNRPSTRGTTNDQRMREASEDVAGEFRQCRGCTDWVCRHFCWDQRVDCCRNCAAAQAPPAYGAPSYDQGYGTPPQVAPAYGAQSYPEQYAAQGYGGQAHGAPPAPAPAEPTRYCGHCGAEGTGRFCGACGTSYDAPPCRGCGAPQRGTPFCQNCGTAAG
ncbi:hypothetical protein [Pseudonocardia ailaonensis]